MYAIDLAEKLTQLRIQLVCSFDICFGYDVAMPNFLLNQLILIGKVYIFQCKTAEHNYGNHYKL